MSRRQAFKLDSTQLNSLQTSIEQELRPITTHDSKPNVAVSTKNAGPNGSGFVTAHPSYRSQPNKKKPRQTNRAYRMSLPVQRTNTLTVQEAIASQKFNDIPPRLPAHQVHSLSEVDEISFTQQTFGKAVVVPASRTIPESPKQSKANKEYERYREQALQGKYPQIEALQIMHLSGTDTLGRQIVICEATNLSAKDVNLEDLLLYCIQLLDPVVDNDYVLVFIGTGVKRANRPPLDWLKKAYSMFNRGYKKNLKTLYVVHPNRWIRATLTLCRPFVSNKFWKKVVFIDNIDDIYKTIDPSEIKFSTNTIRYNSKINSRTPVFGASLADILRIEHSSTGIPEVVCKSVEYLRNHLDVQGIFRQSGLSSHIDELKKSFDRGEDVDLSDEDDPHSVASLLKQFLRELANPVFTYDMYETFLQIQTSMGNFLEAWIPTMLNLLATLPKEHLLVMKVIFDLADEAQRHSEQSFMDAKNLSIVLGPNLLRGLNEDCITSMQNTPLCNSLVRNMIENHGALFGDKFNELLEKR